MQTPSRTSAMRACTAVGAPRQFSGPSTAEQSQGCSSTTLSLWRAVGDRAQQAVLCSENRHAGDQAADSLPPQTHTLWPADSSASISLAPQSSSLFSYPLPGCAPMGGSMIYLGVVLAPGMGEEEGRRQQKDRE